MEGDTIYLRYPIPSDYRDWALLRKKSADFLRPWEPLWPRDDLSLSAFKLRLKRYQTDIKNGRGYPFFIFRTEGDTILGGITLGHVKRGVSQSAQIGYWIGEPFARQGYMREALNLVCDFAFSHHGLHRLEAACIPSNTRSVGLLEKTGFEREGTLRSYLKIKGLWQDHILYARINPLHNKQQPAKIYKNGDQ